MQMPGRTYTASTSGYWYGFNGQEKSSEINSDDNLYAAEFWEYDSRIARRWNLDPRPSIGVSQYSAFNNSPIFFNDPIGDTIKIYGSAEASNTTLNQKGGTADLAGSALNIKDARLVPAVDPKNSNRIVGYNVFDTKNTDRNMPVMQIEAGDIETFKKGYDGLMTAARLYYANGEPSEGMKKYVAAFDFNAGKIDWKLAWSGFKQANKEAWSDPVYRAQVVLSFMNMGLAIAEYNPASNRVSNAPYKTGSSAAIKTMNGSDAYHRRPNIIKNYASGSTKFTITGADNVKRTLYQIEGSLNGKDGRFEWILEKGQITHQQFIPGGKINGTPIKL